MKQLQAYPVADDVDFAELEAEHATDNAADIVVLTAGHPSGDEPVGATPRVRAADLRRRLDTRGPIEPPDLGI